MNLNFRTEISDAYASSTQKAWVMSEDWVERMLPCPSCGFSALTRQSNNSRISDFVCASCTEHFELKASAKPLGLKIPDGAFGTMMERLRADTSPNLLYLHYDGPELKVRSLSLTPKHFLTVEAIERLGNCFTLAQVYEFEPHLVIAHPTRL